MDPNFKMLLDEIKVVQTLIANIDSMLSSRINSVEHTIVGRFDKIEHAVQVFDTWKPKVDASMAEMRAEIGAFRKTDEVVERIRTEMTALRKTVSRAAVTPNFKDKIECIKLMCAQGSVTHIS